LRVRFFSAQCFADAFTSAARTITFALQSVCDEIPGFKEWYSERQKALKDDPLARFFHRYRTASVHVGDTVVRGGATETGPDGITRVLYFFIEVSDIPDPPAEDVYGACRTFFVTLLRLVLDMYKAFPFAIDDRWYFTQENFEHLNKSIEDAEEELGFPRGWTNGIAPLETRWRLLRSNHTSGCEIQSLFEEYLGERFPGPDDSPKKEADAPPGTDNVAI